MNNDSFVFSNKDVTPARKVMSRVRLTKKPIMSFVKLKSFYKSEKSEVESESDGSDTA